MPICCHHNVLQAPGRSTCSDWPKFSTACASLPRQAPGSQPPAVADAEQEGSKAAPAAADDRQQSTTVVELYDDSMDADLQVGCRFESFRGNGRCSEGLCAEPATCPLWLCHAGSVGFKNAGDIFCDPPACRPSRLLNNGSRSSNNTPIVRRNSAPTAVQRWSRLSASVCVAATASQRAAEPLKGPAARGRRGDRAGPGRCGALPDGYPRARTSRLPNDFPWTAF